MKAVILAGGMGTRLSEETDLKPKPMVEIGHQPILWHILKIYSAHGINDFIICCGYKGYVIKEYFNNYFLHNSDVTFSLRDNKIDIHQNQSEPWKITLIDTGHASMTGGRLKRVYDYIKDEEAFCFTYGDGVGNVNITELVAFHRAHNDLATVTAVRPPGRYGALVFTDDDKVLEFQEKPEGDNSWINGGFFVLSPDVISLIDNDNTSWENQPLKQLAAEGNLAAFKHYGFWHPMDTLRDKNMLHRMWIDGKAPWKVW